MPITLTRTILVILIPGGISIISWVFFFLLKFDAEEADSFYKIHTVPINLCLFSAAVIIGTILEGMNTHFEVWLDKRRENKYNIEENWYAYLSSTPKSEPVGFKYISRLVTTFYYELGMMWASLSFGFGISAIICSIKPLDYTLYSILSIVLSVVSFTYFLWQASSSHHVLCKARQQLNSRVKC